MPLVESTTPPNKSPGVQSGNTVRFRDYASSVSFEERVFGTIVVPSNRILRPQLYLIGGPIDDNSPHNLCCYRAPVPGRLASFSRSLIPELASVDQLPRQRWPTECHPRHRQNLDTECPASSLCRMQRVDIDAQSRGFQHNFEQPLMIDCSAWLAARRSHDGSQHATRNGSSPAIGLSSEADSRLEALSQNLVFGLTWHCASFSCRNLLHRCVHAPRQLKRPVETFRTHRVARSIETRIKAWRGLGRDR